MTMRRFMDLMENANFHFPDAMTVFPDREVALILRYGFDVGAKFNQKRGSRDIDALWQLFEDEFESEPEAADALAKLTNWLRGPRYNYVAAVLRSEIVKLSGGVLVHRAIDVSQKVLDRLLVGDVQRLGEFWSFSKSTEPHWSRERASDIGVKLSAVVAYDDVDWVTTIRRNSNYSYGDDETEITLAKGTPLRVVGIAVSGKDANVQPWDCVA